VKRRMRDGRRMLCDLRRRGLLGLRWL
jgi:hypothetical protein